MDRLRKTWVVCWNSRRCTEGGQLLDALAGNGPIMVGDDWTVDHAGTAHPIDCYVDEFENRFE